MTPITYHSADVNGLKVFYRQAGHPGAPKLLLLHGYPTASHKLRHQVTPDMSRPGRDPVPAPHD